MINASADRASDRVSVRDVLRGAQTAVKRPPRRRTKALVGWLLYCVTAVGGTAAALSVHDTLFPTLGGSTQTGPLTGVWKSSVKPDETTKTDSTQVASTDALAQAVSLPT